MRPPLNTMSKEAYDAGLTALQTEMTASHASALASLRTEHENALATQRRELTSAASPAAASNRAEIVAAERTRISSILDHAEAKDRAGLAHHLALKSDMTAEDVVAILAASAKDVTSARMMTHRLDAIVPIPRVGADLDGGEPQSERQRGAEGFAAARQASGLGPSNRQGGERS